MGWVRKRVRLCRGMRAPSLEPLVAPEAAPLKLVPRMLRRDEDVPLNRAVEPGGALDAADDGAEGHRVTVAPAYRSHPWHFP